MQASSDTAMDRTGAGTPLELVMFESGISDIQQSNGSTASDVQVPVCVFIVDLVFAVCIHCICFICIIFLKNECHFLNFWGGSQLIHESPYPQFSGQLIAK